MVVRLLFVLWVMLAVATPALAQDFRLYVGGAVDVVRQTSGSTPALGGTAPGARMSVGFWLSPTLAIELETASGSTWSGAYSYNPFALSPLVTVASTRHDVVTALQVRVPFPHVEAVVGFAYVRGRVQRVATFATGATYFRDDGQDNAIGISAGADVPVRMARHLWLTPGFRVLLRPEGGAGDGFARDTATGSIGLRVGLGARVAF